MTDELARVDRQIGFTAHAYRQLADRPLVGQLDPVDRHRLGMTFGGRRRHDADPDTALDEPADGVEAAQLNTQPETSTDLLRLFRQKALQGARPVETDKVEVERLGKGDMLRR